MKRMAAVLAALGLLGAIQTGQALEIRFYPSKQVRAYEVDAARGIRSVVLQNVAIVNDEDGEVTVSEVDIEALSSGVVAETRVLRAADLDRIAATGSQLQGLGMLDLLPFQFGGNALLGKDVKLAGTRKLQGGAALLLMQQVLTYSGKREALRIRVKTQTGTAEASLPVSTEASSTAFMLPLEGMWYDGAGPSAHSHHRWVVPQEFAHDFTRIGAGGMSYSGDGTRFTDYYAYAQPVLAAAEGQVVAVLDEEQEEVTLLRKADEALAPYVQRIVERQNTQLARGARGIVGNHIVIGHGGEYSLYAHLKPGSVRVKVGDRVRRGQAIALVGSSGSSTEPHLHFHVCDGPDVMQCAGIPARFDSIDIYGALEPRQLQSGDLVKNERK
jgi:murein DD-endopeptidase MepM/ murein hydrolase activator NlpD